MIKSLNALHVNTKLVLNYQSFCVCANSSSILATKNLIIKLVCRVSGHRTVGDLATWRLVTQVSFYLTLYLVSQCS